MKKLLIYLCLVTSAITILYSCNKSNDAKPSKNTQTFSSPAALMEHVILGEKNSDYTVLTSSVLPLSLFGMQDLTKVSSGVQAYSKDFKQVGSLYVNTHAVPFTIANSYLLQSNSTNNLQAILGTSTNYQLTSNTVGDMSFKTMFTPNRIASFTVGGLVNKGINRGTSISMEWNALQSEVGSTTIVVISGTEINTGNQVLEYFEIAEDDMSISINATTLAKFAACEAIYLHLARGSSKLLTIMEGAKKVNMQDLNYSWSKVYFN
jgi:hypothetical protein